MGHFGHRLTDKYDEHLGFSNLYSSPPENVFQVYWFRCNDKNKRNGETFYRGSTLQGFNSYDNANFFDLNYLNIGESIYDISYISKKVQIPNVLDLRGLGLDEREKSTQIFVAYEAFDDTFDSWRIKNPTKMDKKWLICQINRVLESMREMHRENMFHGRLSDVKSYVVIMNDICLINVGIRIGLNDNGEEKKKLVQNDLDGFWLFLTSFALIDVDWKYFKLTYRFSSVNQLLQHPFLLTSLERSKYHRVIADYEKNVMDTNERNMFQYQLMTDSKYYVWDKNFTFNTMFSRILLYHGAYRGDNDPYALFKFIEKVFDHQAQDIKQTSINEEYILRREQLESKISNEYPGFLSFIHHILVFWVPRATSITGKHSNHE